MPAIPDNINWHYITELLCVHVAVLINVISHTDNVYYIHVTLYMYCMYCTLSLLPCVHVGLKLDCNIAPIIIMGTVEKTIRLLYWPPTPSPGVPISRPGTMYMYIHTYTRLSPAGLSQGYPMLVSHKAWHYVHVHTHTCTRLSPLVSHKAWHYVHVHVYTRPVTRPVTRPGTMYICTYRVCLKAWLWL